MILQTIRLRNFRNHDDLTCAFTAGVNAVVGANGSGKSSVIEAIMFLLFGEGYGSKATMLKAGEISGWVEGTVLFQDGKEARLKRELHASKVTLSYDGVDYVKAGDVKQLWDKLFQIDGNVFRNINVASQGEIPLLFSGDEAVRRAVFQKVFMVPNTNTIRNSVWNDYIKKAPSEYITLSDLEVQQKNKQAFDTALTIESTTRRLHALTTLTPDELATAQKEIFEAQRCINAQAQRKTLEETIVKTDKTIKTLKASIASCAADLAGAPELTLLSSLEKGCVTQKAQDEAQKATVAKLAALKRTLPNADDVTKANNAIATNTLLLNDLQSSVAIWSAELVTKESQRKKLSCVAGHKECPTCGSELHDVTPILKEIEAEAVVLKTNVAKTNVEIATTRRTIDADTRFLSSANTLQSQVVQLEALIHDVEPYDEAAHKNIEEAIVRLTGLTKQKTQLENDLKIAENNRANTIATLNGLPVFKSNTFSTAEDLIQWNNTIITSHNANVASDRQLRLEIQKATLIVEQIDRELKQSEANKQLNLKRKSYTDGLQKIYDVLHPSQFAAMLIKTYATTLEAKLTKYLSQFNFKYTVKVSDEFNMIVSNEEGDVLPKVSGGQAMVIGLSLRLALHDMFSQSLSMFCCDEPTQGLDTENQALLFELVENLKQSGIQQVIIIDHNTALSRVVDNCINL